MEASGEPSGAREQVQDAYPACFHDVIIADLERLWVRFVGGGLRGGSGL